MSDVQPIADHPSVPGVPSPGGLPGRVQPAGGPRANRAGRPAESHHSPSHEHAHTSPQTLQGDGIARYLLKAFGPQVGIGPNMSRIVVGSLVVFER